MRHYLLVTEADFAKAACEQNDDAEEAKKRGAKSGALFAQKAAQHASAPESTPSQELTQSVNRKGVMQDGAISCHTLHNPEMEAAGIEPASRDTSDRASTCLADSYLSRPLRSLLASVQCASLELF
jgi:hypothetical protein